MNAGAYTTCDVRWHNNNDSSSNVQRFIDFHSIYYIDIIIFVTYWCCRRTYNSYIVYTQTEQYICLGFFLNSFMRTKPIEMYFFGIFLSCLWISTLLCAKFNFLGLWRLLLHPSPHMDIILLRQTDSTQRHLLMVNGMYVSRHTCIYSPSTWMRGISMGIYIQMNR